MDQIINNGGRLQRGVPRRDGWTVERRRLFLEALLATASVTRAERAAGMSEGCANKLRRRDPAFSALWEEALELGYARLEHELLAHALGRAPSPNNPDPDPDPDPDLGPEGPEGAGRAAAPAEPFDPDLAIRVLRVRGKARPRRRSGPPPGTPAEDQAELMRKLAVMAEKMGLEKREGA